MIYFRVITVLSTLLVPSLSGAQGPGMIPGSVDVQGEIFESACFVPPDSGTEAIDFSELSLDEINFKSPDVFSKNIKVKLMGCFFSNKEKSDFRKYSASVTFSGDAVDKGDLLIPVDEKNKGISISLNDSDGKQIVLGEMTPYYTLNNSNGFLYFTANVVVKKPLVYTGQFYATARFTLNYQ